MPPAGSPRARSVVLPGSRDVRGTLEAPTGDDPSGCVVACPPHPRLGGDRHDARLGGVSEALRERGIACLRIDYGPWDEGRGETTDVCTAVTWARDRFERVGLFGYSFGGTVALLAARDAESDAVSVLAPDASAGDLDVVAAISRLDAPLQVLYGEQDETVDWQPVVDAAREHDADVVGFPAAHGFRGQTDTVGETVAEFFAATL